MDTSTQQSAALVEQACAGSPKAQVQGLKEVVILLKLEAVR